MRVGRGQHHLQLGIACCSPTGLNRRSSTTDLQQQPLGRIRLQIVGAPPDIGVLERGSGINIDQQATFCFVDQLPKWTRPCMLCPIPQLAGPCPSNIRIDVEQHTQLIELIQANRLSAVSERGGSGEQHYGER